MESMPHDLGKQASWIKEADDKDVHNLYWTN